MRWSEAKTVKFVELYRDHECLWNVCKPIYRNRQMRIAALEQIVEEMNIDGFTVTDARLKIKNLRSTYSQEVHKIEKSIRSGISEEYVYTPALKWFKIMDAFVRNIKEKQSTQSDMDFQPEETECKPQIIKKEATLRSTSQSSRPSSSRGRKRRLQDLSSAESELHQLTESVTHAAEEDEFDTFARYLALSLKKMPIQLALQCETDLQATLNQYRMMAVTPVDQ